MNIGVCTMNPVAQYDSSVDIHISVGESGAYTCQQSSFTGAHYYDGWFKDQVTPSGVLWRVVQEYPVDWESTRVPGFDEKPI